MSGRIPDGALVKVARGLGRVVRSEKRHGANGYVVSFEVYPGYGDGYLPHFTQDWCVEPLDPNRHLCTQWPPECGRTHHRDPATRALWAKLQQDQLDQNKNTTKETA